MKRFKISEDIILEDTEKIVLHNFPPSPNTYSYITRIYKQLSKTSPSKEIEGDAIYLHDLNSELVGLAQILGTAQLILSKKLPYENHLIEKEIITNR